MLTKLKVRRGCTVPSPLTCTSTKKSDGTKEFATTDSMDGCNVLPETQFVGTRLRVDTTRVLSVGGNLPPCGAAGERSEFNIKPLLGAPLLIFPRGYLLKSFSRVDTSARQQGFEIRVFPLLGELPKVSSHTCPYASYTTGNSVPACGLFHLTTSLVHTLCSVFSPYSIVSS